jgi:hypothetical protein
MSAGFFWQVKNGDEACPGLRSLRQDQGRLYGAEVGWFFVRLAELIRRGLSSRAKTRDPSVRTSKTSQRLTGI